MKKLFSLCLMAMAAIVVMAYPTRVYLCGPGTPSGWATESNPMWTNVAADGVTPTGTYEWVGELNNGEVKFLYGSSWEPGYASATDAEALTAGTHTIVDRPTGSNPDNKFAATAGRYKLVLDVTAMTLTVSDGTGLADKNGLGQVFAEPLPEHLYAVGSACPAGWTPSSSIEMQNTGEGTFKGHTTLYAFNSSSEQYNELKFLCQQDWGAHFGPVADGEVINGVGTYTIARNPSGQDYKYHVQLTETKNLQFVMNLNDSTLTISEYVPVCETFFLIGPATGGWSLDDNALATTGTDSVFTYEGPIQAGDLKFVEEKNWSCKKWGATAANTDATNNGEYDLAPVSDDADYKFVMKADSNVTLVMNLKTGKMTVTYSGTTSLVDALEDEVKAVKMLENGRIVILKNGIRYDVTGAKL